MMPPNQRAAMSQALGSAPPAQMPPNGAPPPGPGAPPPGGGQMSPEQAQQYLASKGITPDDLETLVMAIDAVMSAGGAGGPPQGGPPAA